MTEEVKEEKVAEEVTETPEVTETEEVKEEKVTEEVTETPEVTKTEEVKEEKVTEEVKKENKKGSFVDKLKDQIADLTNKSKAEIDRLTKENEELKNEALMAKADMVNYRRRKDEEVEKKLTYCNEDLVKELLPIIDNFERAIKLDDDDLTDELSKFLEGFKMVYCNQVNILEKYGVKAIDGNNKVFDPNYHQAVLTEHKEGVEPGMVLEILQKGYLLKDKVIRHAMVKVSE